MPRIGDGCNFNYLGYVGLLLKIIHGPSHSSSSDWSETHIKLRHHPERHGFTTGDANPCWRICAQPIRYPKEYEQSACTKAEGRE